MVKYYNQAFLILKKKKPFLGKSLKKEGTVRPVYILSGLGEKK